MNTQQTEALRALAEAVKGWNSTRVWPHEDGEEIAILGHINDDGEKYPVAEINVDTYFREGESIALANFYAAANPAAVLALLDRIAELESRNPLPLSIERLEELWAAQRRFHGGEPLKMGHVEFLRLAEVEYGVLGRIPMGEEDGGRIDPARRRWS